MSERNSANIEDLLPEGPDYYAPEPLPVTPIFEPGDIVEFAGDQAVVLRNHGTHGDVQFADRSVWNWDWVYEGIPVTLVLKREV